MPVSKRDTTFTEDEIEQLIADTFDDSVTYQDGTLKVVDHKQFG